MAFTVLLIWLYSLLQSLLDKVFSPPPPGPGAKRHRRRIAVIGTGLTGISAASHCIGHGFDVTIFEAEGPELLGGIWARVNSTSGLQIHSLMYRFHPSVIFEDNYPKQGKIVKEIRRLWQRYGLEKRTKFHTKVTKVYKDEQGLWIVNDPSHGQFHGVIPAIGTCGAPFLPELAGKDNFRGEIFHSSELDGKVAQGKKVVVIGGGASAIEALEWAAETGAKHIKVLARSEKWIIPRNLLIDTILACNFFGYETFLSWIPETLLRLFHYRDLKEISPSSDHGLYTDTPMVDNNTFRLIRAGKAEWLRGDITELREKSIVFNHRASGVPKGVIGQSKIVDADFIVMATGYQRPPLDFLPKEVFKGSYPPPRWYLQCFPTQHPTICCNNATYIAGIGSVGNWHIGMYTRLLLVFVLDPSATPSTWWMQRWVDLVSLFKILAPTRALDFFTYPELISWFVIASIVNPFRWKWALFILFGWSLTSLDHDQLPSLDKIKDALPSLDQVKQQLPSLDQAKQHLPSLDQAKKLAFIDQDKKLPLIEDEEKELPSIDQHQEAGQKLPSGKQAKKQLTSALKQTKNLANGAVNGIANGTTNGTANGKVHVNGSDLD
ncbi:hypothetical protein DV735_g1047, partial [Chaetothyriales sp. CBS 134920]